jgi:hypothetical protein
LTTYDALPYVGHPFPQTHPDRLALLGALHGLEPADPDHCRVLELGCGDGMNLVGMAAAAAGVSALGIDAAAGPLERGRRYASALGLENLELRAADIRSADTAGEFDYVIAHGVWSWVDADTREALLTLIAGALAPEGIGFVSYLALPGARLRELGRDAARRLDGDLEALRALEPWASQRQDLYGQLLGQELGRMLGRPPYVLRHDELAEDWQPFWLSQVTGAAERHGLRFMAEADTLELRDNWLPSGTDALLDRLAGPDPVARGDVADIISGRGFRQTLLCHAERAPAEPRLRRLRFGPERLDFAEWAAGHADPESEALKQFRAGALEIHAAAPRYAEHAPERPEAFALARLQAVESEDVTNLRHEHLRLEDPYSRLLVASLDGTRDRIELVAYLTAEIERRGLAPQVGEELRRRISEGLENSLESLAQLALLRAGP